MAHLFQDKLFVFIGTPTRCSRQTARDALTAVGGIVDEKITAFANYVVACNRAAGTQMYIKALKYEQSGLLTVLTEEQFFDVLDGKTAPPVKPKRDSNVIIMPGIDPEAEARETERIHNDILNRKRMNSLVKYGVPTPDGGRVKADLRHIDKARRVLELMESGAGTVIRGTDSYPERCDK